MTDTTKIIIAAAALVAVTFALTWFFKPAEVVHEYSSPNDSLSAAYEVNFAKMKEKNAELTDSLAKSDSIITELILSKLQIKKNYVQKRIQMLSAPADTVADFVFTNIIGAKDSTK